MINHVDIQLFGYPKEFFSYEKYNLQWSVLLKIYVYSEGLTLSGIHIWLGCKRGKFYTQTYKYPFRACSSLFWTFNSERFNLSKTRWTSTTTRLLNSWSPPHCNLLVSSRKLKERTQQGKESYTLCC